MEPSSSPSSASVWNYKPWWCQPWSIGLTGVSIIGGSWLVLRLVWVTALVALPVLAWMGFFLILYPRLFKAHMEQVGRAPLSESPAHASDESQ